MRKMRDNTRRLKKLIVFVLAFVVLFTTVSSIDVEAASKKPKKVVIKSVKSPSTGKVTVKWKKVSGTKGYQVVVGTNKKCTSNKKSATVKKKSSYKTFKGLKKGKKYYVRVRAYKVVRGKKVYGAWSGAKAVKVKGKATPVKKPSKSKHVHKYKKTTDIIGGYHETRYRVVDDYKIIGYIGGYKCLACGEEFLTDPIPVGQKASAEDIRKIDNALSHHRDTVHDAPNTTIPDREVKVRVGSHQEAYQVWIEPKVTTHYECSCGAKK